MTKANLRREALTRRRALPADELVRRSVELQKCLFEHFALAAWNWLHVFLPIPQQNEPDTWRIIRWIWEQRLPVQLAVPIVQPDGQSLRHYHLAPSTELTTNRWGIPEPVGAEEVLPPQFDAILVPLLAFDEEGHRVGYGKGFYDRFLLDCRPDALRIGLSLEPPVPKITDAWSGDMQLNACVTPEGVRWFREAARQL